MPGPLKAALRRRRLDQAAHQSDDEMWQSRLEEAGEEAAKRAQATHGDDVTFTCSYGGVEGGNELKKTAMVQFTWRAVVCEFDGEHCVHVRCDNACERGVPLPENWKASARCIGLPAIATEAAKLARTDLALDAAECLLLGQPKTTLLPDPTIARMPSALVNLLHEGRPR